MTKKLNEELEADGSMRADGPVRCKDYIERTCAAFGIEEGGKDASI